MGKLQTAIVEIAKSQVGARECGGNNKGAEIRKYLDATWMDEKTKNMGFPWCSAFVTWVCKEARKLCGYTFRDIDLYIGAAAYDWETHGIKNGWRILDEWEKAEPGDLVTYDFSHIGIVIEDHGETIFTVEGNTNGRGDRDSDSGDGVWFKDRARGLVKHFIRLPEMG